MDNSTMSANVLLRMSPKEKKSAIHDAHRHDMNLSEYLRFLLQLGHALLERKDQQGAK